MKEAASVDRRGELLDRMAAHLLAHGLEGANLRPLARAAGTSDRMLLYYFADKEELFAQMQAQELLQGQPERVRLLAQLFVVQVPARVLQVDILVLLLEMQELFRLFYPLYIVKCLF